MNFAEAVKHYDDELIQTLIQVLTKGLDTAADEHAREVIIRDLQVLIAERNRRQGGGAA